ncbi:MAG: adenylate/guanylate cyclase domain-containing protein [Acidimicrobiia bacterium]
MRAPSGGLFGSFVVHLFTYAAVCGFLVAFWALTSGSFDEVGDIARDPGLARSLGFWPIWVILAWGVAVVIHLGVALVALPGALARRHRELHRRRRRRRHGRSGPRDTARIAAQVGEQIMARSADALQTIAAGRRSPPSAPSRQWVAVMFTDIANSTALAETLGDDEWTRVLARYRGLVRAAFASRDGKEVGTQGDGFLGRFASPAEAVLCGVDIQREMRDVREQVDLDLGVRIGIHAGEAVEDDGDLIGRVVNLAARVTDQASPGEVLVTEPVADLLGGDGRGGKLALEDKGLCELRGIPQARHLLAVQWHADGEGDG